MITVDATSNLNLVLWCLQEWWALKQSRAFSSSRAEYKWCKQHMIQHSGICEVSLVASSFRLCAIVDCVCE